MKDIVSSVDILNQNYMVLVDESTCANHVALYQRKNNICELIDKKKAEKDNLVDKYNQKRQDDIVSINEKYDALIRDERNNTASRINDIRNRKTENETSTRQDYEKRRHNIERKYLDAIISAENNCTKLFTQAHDDYNNKIDDIERLIEERRREFENQKIARDKDIDNKINNLEDANVQLDKELQLAIDNHIDNLAKSLTINNVAKMKHKPDYKIIDIITKMAENNADIVELKSKKKETFDSGIDEKELKNTAVQELAKKKKSYVKIMLAEKTSAKNIRDVQIKKSYDEEALKLGGNENIEDEICRIQKNSDNIIEEFANNRASELANVDDINNNEETEERIQLEENIKVLEIERDRVAGLISKNEERVELCKRAIIKEVKENIINIKNADMNYKLSGTYVAQGLPKTICIGKYKFTLKKNKVLDNIMKKDTITSLAPINLDMRVDGNVVINAKLDSLQDDMLSNTVLGIIFKYLESVELGKLKLHLFDSSPNSVFNIMNRYSRTLAVNNIVSMHRYLMDDFNNIVSIQNKIDNGNDSQDLHLVVIRNSFRNFTNDASSNDIDELYKLMSDNSCFRFVIVNDASGTKFDTVNFDDNSTVFDYKNGKFTFGETDATLVRFEDDDLHTRLRGSMMQIVEKLK